MSAELLYQISLTIIPGIGDIQGKMLINHFGKASDVFKASMKELESFEGIGRTKANAIKHFDDFKIAEEEIAFLKKYKIKPLFISDEDYPKRLLNCYDNPLLLYYRGNADLNSSKILSIVGTRNHDDYGKHICEKIIEDLKDQDVLIVSGLAFGIDTIAHKSSLKNNLKTVGVLAHGLDRIYPSQNKQLAKQMTDQGGLLTDFKSNTLPDKQNFPKRNRIVAGMCDAVLVIESGNKGGSLITAEIANGYNKDVFAIPGRVNDSKSEGCNFLIKTNKAAMVSGAEDILNNLGWTQSKKKSAQKQKQLFIELTADEKLIYSILQQKDNPHIDEIHFKSNLSSSAVASALLTLEMQNIVASLPGKTYRLL